MHSHYLDDALRVGLRGIHTDDKISCHVPLGTVQPEGEEHKKHLFPHCW